MNWNVINYSQLTFDDNLWCACGLSLRLKSHSSSISIFTLYIFFPGIYKCVWWKRTSAGWSWTNQLIITKWTSEFRIYCPPYPRRPNVPLVFIRANGFSRNYLVLYQVIFRMRRLRTGSKHCLLSNDILDLDPFSFRNASFEPE